MTCIHFTGPGVLPPMSANEQMLLAALKNLVQRFEHEMTQAHGLKYGPPSDLGEAREAHEAIDRAEGRR